MRIGIDATSWTNRRGFGRFVRELVQAIAALDTGDEYVLLADRQTAEQATFPSDWQVLVGETSVSPTQAATADGRRSLGDILAMRRLARQEPLDLIFFPAVYSYYPVGGRVPCLVTFHDVIAETLPDLVFKTRRSRFFWDLKARLAIRRSSCAVTVSQASRQGLMDVFGLRGSQVRVISEAPSAAFKPIDTETEAHREALERCEIRPGERFFVYVGGISPNKNLGALIDAFIKVLAGASPDLRLILVGDYEGDVFRTCHHALLQQIEKLGITDQVRFTGYLPDTDVAHLYAASEAFVFPSFLEGFGLPAVEAMACGAAVIASDRGSLPEVLGGAGHLFDPHDVEALAGALARVAADDDYRKQLKSRSLDRALDFSWEKSARQAVEIFHEFEP